MFRRASVPKLGYAYAQGVRGENISAITEKGRNYPLKQNCNFQMETSFCASKSPKFPCILPCKVVFLSNIHTNDCNDEQAFIKTQIKCHVCADLRSGHAPLSNTDLRSLSNEFAHLPNRLQIMFFLVFCSVDGWSVGG